jgi:hypothetical protein
MKNTMMSAVISVLAIAAISGCSKSSSSGSSTSMKTSLNGVAFSGSDCIDSVTDSTLFIYGTNFTTSITYPFIEIIITKYTGTGTYTLGTWGSFGGGPSTMAVIDSSASNAVASLYGTVTITSVSPNLTGTFSFTCTDSTKVTGGSFTGNKP